MEDFLLKNERILLKYRPNAWDYYVYMLTKYILPIFLGCFLVGTIIPLSGGASWGLYFLFIAGLMGLLFLIITPISLLAPTPICIVTNMRIYKQAAATSCWIFYPEIKNMKLSGSGKKVGTIKIKTVKFDMLDYNLYVVKNPDEVYRMLKSAQKDFLKVVNR